MPIQTVVGVMLWWLGSNVQTLLEAVSCSAMLKSILLNVCSAQDEPDVNTLTALFFTLVFFAATQDIAVDGEGPRIVHLVLL